MGWPCVSCYNWRTHFSKNPPGNFEEQALLLTGPGGCIAHRGPHRLWERKRNRDRDLGALPLLSSEDGVWGCMGHSSLKRESRSYGLVFFQVVGFLVSHRAPKGELPECGRPSALACCFDSSCFTQLVICLLKMGVFRNGCLSTYIAIKSLMLRAYTTLVFPQISSVQFSRSVVSDSATP